MQKIIDLGFTKAAEFHLNNGALECAIHRYADASRCLYVLIECPGDETVDEDLNQIFYIGHTRRTFQRRMDDYKKGFKKQKQNYRVKDSIFSRLSAGARVESWIWIDALSLQVRDLRVDVAAGLEYDLINYYRAHNQKHNHLPLLNVDGNGPKEIIVMDTEEISAPAIGQTAESTNALKSFRITLGKTYWEYPVFNIPVEHQELFGESNGRIRIDFALNNTLVRSLEENINRKANPNGTPRIYIHGVEGQWYRDWLHTHFQEEANVPVEILGPNHLRFIANN
jgi:hypothetical protein